LFAVLAQQYFFSSFIADFVLKSLHS